MHLRRKVLAVVSSSLVIFFTIGILLANVGCSDSETGPSQANVQEVQNYKDKMKELKAAKKADKRSGNKK